MKFLSLKFTDDTRLVRHLALASIRCELIAKTVLTLWASIILKQRNTVLAKVKDSISFDIFMDCHTAIISFRDRSFIR